VMDPSRRCLLKHYCAVFGARIIASGMAGTSLLPLDAQSSSPRLVRLSFNENPYGPSPHVAEAIQQEFNRLSHYADSQAAQLLAEQIATYEQCRLNRWFWARSSDF
jgi:histidinol-phosphate/aromatic aminotransferase/cobyric acid decarboxylase-like protein